MMEWTAAYVRKDRNVLVLEVEMRAIWECADIQNRVSPENVRLLDDLLKTRCIVPKDAYLESFGTMIDRDALAMKYIHPSFPKLPPGSVCEIHHVSCSDLSRSVKPLNVKR